MVDSHEASSHTDWLRNGGAANERNWHRVPRSSNVRESKRGEQCDRILSVRRDEERRGRAGCSAPCLQSPSGSRSSGTRAILERLFWFLCSTRRDLTRACPRIPCHPEFPLPAGGNFQPISLRIEGGPDCERCPAAKLSGPLICRHWSERKKKIKNKT